jgi:hypothetical protein
MSVVGSIATLGGSSDDAGYWEKLTLWRILIQGPKITFSAVGNTVIRRAARPDAPSPEQTLGRLPAVIQS